MMLQLTELIASNIPWATMSKLAIEILFVYSGAGLKTVNISNKTEFGHVVQWVKKMFFFCNKVTYWPCPTLLWHFLSAHSWGTASWTILEFEPVDILPEIVIQKVGLLRFTYHSINQNFLVMLTDFHIIFFKKRGLVSNAGTGQACLTCIAIPNQNKLSVLWAIYALT